MEKPTESPSKFQQPPLGDSSRIPASPARQANSLSQSNVSFLDSTDAPSCESLILRLNEQSKLLRDNKAITLRSEREKEIMENEFEIERLRFEREVTELRKRINGYQNLSYMYQEKTKEVSMFKAECEQLKATLEQSKASQEGIMTQSAPHEDTTLTAPQQGPLKVPSPQAMDISPQTNVSTTDRSPVTQVIERTPSEDMLYSVSTTEVLPSDASDTTDTRLKQMEEKLTDWSLHSMPSLEQSITEVMQVTVKEDLLSPGSLDALTPVSEMLCNLVGVKSASPLAALMVRLTLLVLQKEQEVYGNKPHQSPATQAEALQQSTAISTPQQQTSQRAAPKPAESPTRRLPAESPSRRLPPEQQTDMKERLDAALRSLNEQEKMHASLQERMRQQEAEGRNLEMERRLWVIEQDCLKDQVRSLKRDLERVQRENQALRGNLERMSGQMSGGLSAGQNEESLRSMSQPELITEVAVLQHQVTVYKEDFDRERQDRSQAQAEKEALQSDNSKLKKELEVKSEQLESKERQYQMLFGKFNALSHEYARNQEFPKFRPSDQQFRPSDQPYPILQRPPLQYSRIDQIAGGSAPSSSPSPLGGATVASGPGWRCRSCTYDNATPMTRCEICDTPRHDLYTTQHSPSHIHYSDPGRRRTHPPPSGFAHRGRIECDQRNQHSQSEPPSMDVLPSILNKHHGT